MAGVRVVYRELSIQVEDGVGIVVGNRWKKTENHMTLSAGCYGAGYLTGLITFVWMARRRGLATEGIFALLAAGMIGGLLCANLTQWLATGEAGKTILGGIAGGYMSVLLAKKLLGIRRPTGDLFAVAICAGEAVGRWGCFFGGCCYGKPTNAAWAVRQHGAFRHPTQLYLSLACLLILVLLVMLESRRNAVLPENVLFCVQGALYCVARFIVEFWREHPDNARITAAQWACAAGLIFFCVRLYQTVQGGKSLLRAENRHEAVSCMQTADNA